MMVHLYYYFGLFMVNLRYVMWLKNVFILYLFIIYNLKENTFKI
jgi:hypothetical protein